MQLIRNLRIKYAIALAVLVPSLAALFFAGNLALREERNAQDMDNIVGFTRLAVHLSDLVHEQQKERGATAGFLASGGTRFQDELAAQRRATDVRRSEFEGFADRFAFGGADDAFRSDF